MIKVNMRALDSVVSTLGGPLKAGADSNVRIRVFSNSTHSEAAARLRELVLDETTMWDDEFVYLGDGIVSETVALIEATDPRAAVLITDRFLAVTSAAIGCRAITRA